MSAPTINVPTTTIVGGKRTTLELLSAEIDRIAASLYETTIDALIAAAVSGKWSIHPTIAAGQAATPPGSVFAVFDTDADALAFYRRDASSSAFLGAIEGTAALTAAIQVAIDAKDASEAARDDAEAAAAAAGLMTGPGLLGRTAATTGAAFKIGVGAGLEFEDDVLQVAIDSPPDPSDADDPEAYLWSPEEVADAIDARAGGLVATGSFSAAAVINIALPGAFTEAEILLEVSGASLSDAGIDAQFTRDGFTTLLNGASDYRWGAAGLVYAVATGAGIASASDSKMRLVAQGSNSGLNTSPAALLRLKIPGYADNTSVKRIVSEITMLNTIGNLQRVRSDGVLRASDPVTAVNGVRLVPSGGNITGTYKVLVR